MLHADTDELVAIEKVRVVGSTATALHCAIGGKRVWLPREHIRGRLFRRGDSGTLLVRRWVALDRRLAVPDGTPALHLVCRSVPSPRSARRLQLVHRTPSTLGH
jgi:hypothetical protein